MKEKSDEPAKQPPDTGQPEAQEQPKYRELSLEQLTQILEAHQKWVESDGKEGKRADLSEVDLHEAHLRDANLQKAHLRDANLQGADLTDANLWGANLQKAHLRDANLQKANLTEANLQKARLRDANLQEANLTRADLQGANLTEVKGLSEATLQSANLDAVTGLLGSEFARADVTGTRLPEDIRGFKVLQVVEETSRNARKIFFSMLLGCIYSWLTIATTTDVNLLTNSASSPLPIIGTKIPIAYFYWAAPVILMAFFVYLHFYLQRLWKSLAGLPAIFPDGKPLDERAYPWLLNGLVRRHFERLKEGRSLIAKSEELVTIFLAWWIVPLTLVAFWVRYLPRHEWVGTWIHVGLIVASVAVAIIFYRSAARTLRGTEPRLFRWKTAWCDRRAYQGMAIVLVGIVLSLFSLGAINGVRTIGIFTTDFDDRFVLTNVWTWVPWAFGQLGYHPFADLREKNISSKPDDYWRILAKERDASVTGASLKGRDLRYADAFGAFLSNADLHSAQLQKADLRLAKLQGADLRVAKLQKADLRGANLQKADLRFAQLQKANLSDANLQGANLSGANLQGANFSGADLQKADLSFAKLQKANLSYAELQGANLYWANLQGAKLLFAKLQEADLRFAKLQKADLRGAELQEANLSYAELRGAELREINLEDAEGLTQEQLDGACGDERTKLPPDLSIKRCSKLEKKR